MFTGFKIQAPEYTVITPQTGLVYGVRYLNVSEVSKLKATITIPSKAAEIINEVLWSSIVSKPSGITSYSDFLKYTTLRDREALIYALYITTFGEECDFTVSCNNCNAENKIKSKMSDMFEITPYPGSNAMKSSYGWARAAGVDSDPEMDEIVSRSEPLKVIDNSDNSKWLDEKGNYETEALDEEGNYKSVPSGIDFDEEEPLPVKANYPSIQVSKEEILRRKAEYMERLKEESDKESSSANVKMTNYKETYEFPNISKESKAEDAGIGVGKPIQNRPKPRGSKAFSESVNSTGILNKKIDIELPFSKVHVILRQPTIHHEKEILDEIPFAQRKQTDLANETLIIEAFEEYKPGGKVPIGRYTHREDILSAYRSLPNADKKYLFDQFREQFGDYGMKLKTEWQCKDCGEVNDLTVDVVVQFFRMVAIG